MNKMSDAERSRGVVTFSSGNHAQAVALAGHLLGVSTTIVMPNNAPAVKRLGTEKYATRVIDFDPEIEKREDISDALISKHGYTMLPPFDHPNVIAGQGTAALELFNSCAALDTLLVPLGGGGLLSGCALSAEALSPGCKVIGVEPATR